MHGFELADIKSELKMVSRYVIVDRKTTIDDRRRFFTLLFFSNQIRWHAKAEIFNKTYNPLQFELASTLSDFSTFPSFSNFILFYFILKT